MSKGRGDYPGSNNSNLGSVGRAAEAVCIALSGPQPSKDWQIATEAWCARVGQKADGMVGHDSSANSNTSYNYNSNLLGRNLIHGCY